MKRFLHKYGTRPNEIRRAKKELYSRLTLVALAIVFFAIMIVVSRFQPRLNTSADKAVDRTALEGDLKTNAHLMVLRDRAETVFSEFESLSSEPGGALEHLELLEEAIELQGEVIRSRTSRIAAREDVRKLEKMQTAKDEAMGDYLIAQSNREEEQALDAWQKGDVATAISKMQRAIAVQKKVNEQYPRSSNRSSSRIHRLSNQVIIWQTKPIAEAADDLKDEAFALVKARQFDAARRTIRLAVQKQKQLMQEYRQSSFATLTRMRTFEEALKEIDAAEHIHTINDLLQSSEASLQSGDHASALASAEEALALQTAFIDRLATDDDINTKRLEQIRTVRDTAEGVPVYQAIMAARTATRHALAHGDMETFQVQVAHWYRESRRFLRRFPESRQGELINVTEIEFLYNLRTEIPAIIQIVYDNLIPLRDEGSLYMYRTEVPQSLYESVTSSNPSSAKDPMLPVDSVTWEEAKAFTRQLSMILARPVTLPSETSYHRAVGEPSIVQVGSQAWSSENSSRQVNPCGQLAANDAGFFDLLGNVAEWIDKDANDDPISAKAIGGSARDSRARLVAIPEDLRSPEERNRYIGFRFVVDHEQDLK